jgi:hypothetical protein
MPQLLALIISNPKPPTQTITRAKRLKYKRRTALDRINKKSKSNGSSEQNNARNEAGKKDPPTHHSAETTGIKNHKSANGVQAQEGLQP